MNHYSRYSIPESVRADVLELIRGYDRRELECYKLLHESSKHDESGIKGGIGKPTEAKGIRLAELQADNHIIIDAIKRIPEEYQPFVLNWCKSTRRYRLPEFADASTWKRQRKKFLYYVAEKKGWLDCGN